MFLMDTIKSSLAKVMYFPHVVAEKHMINFRFELYVFSHKLIRW